ncbi:MAG: hypothetical protein ACE5IR_20750 [bacterium]
MKNKWPHARYLFLLTVSLSCSQAAVQHASNSSGPDTTRQDTAKLAIDDKQQPQRQGAARQLASAREQSGRKETVIRPNKSIADIRLENIQRVTPLRDYRNPVWSPSKPDLLAFVGGDGTYLYSLTDREISKLSDEAAGFKFFWTEDGRGLIYRARIGIGVRAIKRIDIDTGKVSILVQSNELSLPQEVAPGIIRYRDGQQYKTLKLSKASSDPHKKPFVYRSNNHVFIVSDRETKQITTEEGKFLLPQASPDGSKILYTKMGHGFYVTDLQQGSTTFLGRGSDAAWSPDSQYIIFEMTADDGHSILTSDLYIADLKGQKEQLTKTTELLEMRPSWSVDGEFIAFDANGAIYLAKLASGR